MAANASDTPRSTSDDSAAESARVRQEAARLRFEASELRDAATALREAADADRAIAATLVRDAEAAAAARLADATAEAGRLRAAAERQVQGLVADGEAAVRALLADAGEAARRRLEEAEADAVRARDEARSQADTIVSAARAEADQRLHDAALVLIRAELVIDRRLDDAEADVVACRQAAAAAALQAWSAAAIAIDRLRDQAALAQDHLAQLAGDGELAPGTITSMRSFLGTAGTGEEMRTAASNTDPSRRGEVAGATALVPPTATRDGTDAHEGAAPVRRPRGIGNLLPDGSAS